MNDGPGLGVLGRLNDGLGLGVIGRLNDGLGALGRLNDGLGALGRLNDGTGALGRLNDGLGVLGRLNDGLGVLGRLNDGAEGAGVIGRLGLIDGLREADLCMLDMRSTSEPRRAASCPNSRPPAIGAISSPTATKPTAALDLIFWRIVNILLLLSPRRPSPYGLLESPPALTTHVPTRSASPITNHTI
ncbi:MAG: hypothetical protein A2Y77_12095 [Planctomycetes bacterium RBG_13_62_9]|nr:MAG: hypothetical protein A2Y77_12095 [Planctomycetes bacterium RBG_13_62_9]